MAFSPKESISSWWILVFMAMFLWYRNIKYDRVMSVFILMLGLVQLLEYAVYSGSNPHTTTRTMFITLWVQCLVLAIASFVFLKSQNQDDPHIQVTTTLAGWNVFIFTIVFIAILIVVFFSGGYFNAEINNDLISWSQNDRPLMGNYTWLYFLGIFIPLFLLFASYSFADLGLALLILYAALTAIYCASKYSENSMITIWCYYGVGFAFLAWLVGIYPLRDITANVDENYL